MEFSEIKRVSQGLGTTDIKGKDYVEVNKRVMGFRELCPNGSITTEIISLEAGMCVIKATVTDEDGKILSTGLAYEKESSSFINKTSYIENCETSAVGRALGFLGIGIDTSIASAEEVGNAIHQQEVKKKPVKVLPDSDPISDGGVDYLSNLIRETNSDLDKMLAYYKVKNLSEMTVAQFKHCCSVLEKR